MGMVWGRFVCAAALAGSLFFYSLCYSEKAPNYSFLRDATSAPPTVYYDYIVVGGGTAGCAVAATLSAGATVLVLERGGSPYGNPNVENLDSYSINLLNVLPTSPSQLFVSEDGVYNNRARVLGGGSAINAGFYTRASEQYVSDAVWDAVGARRAYEWVEEKVAHRPVVGPWQAAVKEGLLDVGVRPDNGFTYEHLPGTKIGGTIFDENGHRHTAADLFEYANPTRTTVYLHASVQKILFRTIGNPRARAYGVAFKDAEGGSHVAFLNDGPGNEIVVSAGAIGSPQLLMLSGIGPRAHLDLHGIPVVMDQPMVGLGMSDNPMNAVLVPSPRPVEISLIQTVGIPQSDGFYVEAASGLSFGRLGLNSFMGSSLQAIESTISPAGAKAMEALNTSLQSLTLNAGILLEKLSAPLSAGHLLLRGRDPDDNPAVTFNYFEHPDDLKQCVEAMSTVTNVIKSEALSSFHFPGVTAEGLLALMVALPLNLRPRRVTAALDLEQFCVDTVLSIWHYHGGCRVGEVVDSEYRVIGVDGLRVVDGSTFHRSPGANPQATVMMLGRYVGERMLSER